MKKDDRVEQGEVVALSGNTGDTGGGAHLHFDVQQCGPNLPPNYNQLPCGQTLPVTFRNTRPHSCGLGSNERYRATNHNHATPLGNRDPVDTAGLAAGATKPPLHLPEHS